MDDEAMVYRRSSFPGRAVWDFAHTCTHHQVLGSLPD